VSERIDDLLLLLLVVDIWCRGIGGQVVGVWLDWLGQTLGCRSLLAALVRCGARCRLVLVLILVLLQLALEMILQVLQD